MGHFEAIVSSGPNPKVKLTLVTCGSVICMQQNNTHYITQKLFSVVQKLTFIYTNRQDCTSSSSKSTTFQLQKNVKQPFPLCQTLIQLP